MADTRNGGQEEKLQRKSMPVRHSITTKHADMLQRQGGEVCQASVGHINTSEKLQSRQRQTTDVCEIRIRNHYVRLELVTVYADREV